MIDMKEDPQKAIKTFIDNNRIGSPIDMERKRKEFKDEWDYHMNNGTGSGFIDFIIQCREEKKQLEDANVHQAMMINGIKGSRAIFWNNLADALDVDKEDDESSIVDSIEKLKQKFDKAHDELEKIKEENVRIVSESIQCHDRNDELTYEHLMLKSKLRMVKQELEKIKEEIKQNNACMNYAHEMRIKAEQALEIEKTENDKLRLLECDLREAREEAGKLKILLEKANEKKGWTCESCNTCYPKPAYEGLNCIICPGCRTPSLMPTEMYEKRKIEGELVVQKALVGILTKKVEMLVN